MLKLTRRARGHPITLIQLYMHLISDSSGHLLDFFIRGYKEVFPSPNILINEYYMTLYLIMLVNELCFD